MPENEFPKLKPHPFRQAEAAEDPIPRRATGAPPYAELCVTSNYTFLTGASHPEEYVRQASGLGYRAIGLSDRLTIAGVVRSHVAAKEHGIQFVLGSRLLFTDMPEISVCVYPTDMESYRRMCRMLTIGKRRAPKGECHLGFEDVASHAAGLLAIVVADDLHAVGSGDSLQQLRRVFDDDRLSLAARMTYGHDDSAHRTRLIDLSEKSWIPLVATNDVHYHHADRRMLHDVLTCIRAGCTIAQAGFRLHANGEQSLKPPEEMHRLFADIPTAIRRTVEIAARAASFSLDLLKYEYPDEVVPFGKTPQQHLTDLAWKGAREKYPEAIPEKVKEAIKHELELIEELRFAPYFLTVYDLVRFARTGEEVPGKEPEKPWTEILCQGRGAAANSAVCYCLGVTAVNPMEINLLFERFLSRERGEPPDIDIDFEHERREDVIQYIYRKYGRDRAALTAEVITYRRRSAVRDVGKALGLSLDLVDRLAKDIEWFDQGIADPQRLRELGLNPDDPTLCWFVELVTQLLGFPRHLSQHVGGFVITRSPLCELVPVENAAMPERTVIEWDKDDIEALGMLKVDVLGLGMLTALRRCLAMVNRNHGTNYRLGSLPPDDERTYRMIQRADTIGVFQVESRAQMSMLPRLKPNSFYDLVIEVAIVRPGPIQGGMVHPYLKRRTGEEAVEELPANVPETVRVGLQKVLGKTLGVPLFQEQCMALATVAAGFSAGDSDKLRRAMASWKRKGHEIKRFGEMLIMGMRNNNIPEEFAARCFKQIQGFSEYGFPESHAASFALLVYDSAWLKCHHPAEFTAALLNSQPMGFYGPAQLVRDAKEHGVMILPVDVHHSQWECTVENGRLRLGLCMVSGMGEADATSIKDAIARDGPFSSMLSLWRASGVKTKAMRRLAGADAFGSMNLTRQQALWQARLLRDEPLPLFDRLDTDALEHEGRDEHDALPAINPLHQVVLDYGATGLSLKAHPVSFAREQLRALDAVPCAALRDPLKTPGGERITVGGLVLVRQRPGTANDVTFITLEDETGIANLIVWYRVYQKFRRQAQSRMIVVTGRVQRKDEVVHLTVESIQGMEQAIGNLVVEARNFH